MTLISKVQSNTLYSLYVDFGIFKKSFRATIMKDAAKKAKTIFKYSYVIV